MNKDEAVQAVIEVLKSVQEVSGREVGVITEETCPIGDLEGFDSLCGVEASAELSTRLGFELPGTNAFVNEKGTKALSVGEMAKVICQFTQKAER